MSFRNQPTHPRSPSRRHAIASTASKGGDVMNANANTWRPGALTRHLILLAGLVAVLSAAFTGAASAQTTFQARVTGINPKPNPPCVSTVTPPTPAVFCGSASIAGYGPAFWTLNATATSLTSPCFTYTGTTTFRLLQSRPPSTLVLDEIGTACSPGKSGSAPSQGFGSPLFANASWTVDPASTGIFAGVTGEGTDTAQSTGAATIGTYTGTLAPPS